MLLSIPYDPQHSRAKVNSISCIFHKHVALQSMNSFWNELIKKSDSLSMCFVLWDDVMVTGPWEWTEDKCVSEKFKNPLPLSVHFLPKSQTGSVRRNDTCMWDCANHVWRTENSVEKGQRQAPWHTPTLMLHPQHHCQVLLFTLKCAHSGSGLVYLVDALKMINVLHWNS